MSFKTAFMSALTFVFLAFTTVTLPAHAATDLLPMPEVGEDGLYVQSWFHDSFLNLNDDLAEANASGKRLVIFWEQRGCPYCKRVHEVNLRIPRINQAVQDGFVALQLNMWGDREVTDFDGEVLKEKDLAEKWGVLFTPTFQFFPQSVAEVNGAPGNKAEVVRIPGYFKPFHFYFLFKYARSNGYEDVPNFQRWLGAIGEKLDAAGVHYDLYADDLPKDLPPGL